MSQEKNHFVQFTEIEDIQKKHVAKEPSWKDEKESKKHKLYQIF